VDEQHGRARLRDQRAADGAEPHLPPARSNPDDDELRVRHGLDQPAGIGKHGRGGDADDALDRQ
jgi:hypothetical protein